MTTFISAFFLLLIEMAPYLLLGFFITGLLHVFVPKAFYRNYLSGSNFRSVFFSALLGVPLPLCSCGVIPTAMSLRKEGASRGAAVSFLIATPQTGVDSILATGALLGWPFAIFRPLVAFITGLFAGELVNKLVPDNSEISADSACSVDSAAGGAVKNASCSSDSERAKRKQTWLARFVEALRYGFVDMMRDIGKWLAMGLVLAAIITAAIPNGFFEQFSDRPFWGALVVLALSVPMYVCATGSIPIAAALIAKGFSPGAAFVLLMAGPATNMAAILIVGKVLGRRTLIIYMSTIILGALLAGAIIDGICPSSWFEIPAATISMACCHSTGFWFKTICGIILLALLFYALVGRTETGQTGTEKSNSSQDIINNQNNPEDYTKKTRKTTYKVSGMTCSHCQAFVERTIRALPTVQSADVSLERGEAIVEGDVSSEEIVRVVSEIGYRIERLR